MAEVAQDPAFAENLQLVYQELQNLHIHEKTSNLSPAAMAIIAIAMSVAMGPAGAGWAGAKGSIATYFTSSATMGMAMQAGAITLATQAATGLASGKGIGGTLESLVQEENLRSLAISMATAGIAAEAGSFGSDFFGTPKVGLDATGYDTLIAIGNQATQAMVQSTISAGVSTVINGGDFHDFSQSFKGSMLTAGIAALGKYMASSIGEAYNDGNGDINNLVRYIAHAGAGCVLGLASSETGDASGGGRESCLTGSVGAVAGELVADSYKAQKTEEFLDAATAEAKRLVEQEGYTPAMVEAHFLSDAKQADINYQVAQMTAAAVDLAKLSGALSALVGEGDVNLGAMTAENAAKNNAFWFVPLAIIALKAIDIALTANELIEIYDALENDKVTGGKEGQRMLNQWLVDQGAGHLIGQFVPGSKTVRELIDWLRNKNVAVSKLDDVTKHIEAKHGEIPPPSVSVINTATTKLDLQDVAGETDMLVKIDVLDIAKRNDGVIGEQTAEHVLKEATGIDFVTYMKNASNNGPDALAMDPNPANKTIWLVEVKSSVAGNFPNVDKLNLETRGWKWIEATALNGVWNNQQMPAEAVAYARDLIKLREQGYAIKPMLAKVSLPPLGSTGVARVTIVPAKVGGG